MTCETEPKHQLIEHKRDASKTTLSPRPPTPGQQNHARVLHLSVLRPETDEADEP